MPPIKNIINVAVQTARQHIPEKKDYEQPRSNTAGAAAAEQNFNSHPQGMFNGEAGEGQYQGKWKIYIYTCIIVYYIVCSYIYSL